MSTTHQDKQGGKNRQRNKKADQRGPKPEPQQSPIIDQRDEDQIAALVASEIAPTEIESTEIEPTEVESIDAPAIGAVTPASHHPTGIQAVAHAYGDFTRKSLQESMSFVEKLMGVRSIDKAIEVQAEFARASYTNFVAESQKICELYGELAKRMFEPWGLAARKTEAELASRTTVASQSRH
jgi:hypothetical protein